jgi:parallel beta-helix repeat protein
MKTFVCILVLLLTSVPSPSLSQEPVPEHPRLFFNLQEANQIRTRALVPGSTENKFFLETKEVADYFVGPPDRKFEMFQEVVPNGPYTPFRQWNLYSLAFTYFVTQNPLYLQGIRDIIFGYSGHPGGLMGFQFVARNTAIVAGLAQTVDLLWNQFSESERSQILQKIQENLQNPAHPGEGVRDYFYNNYLLHDNNHMASNGIGLLSAAIVFNGDPGYPEANSDIDAVRYRIVTYQNNLIVRMNHADGAAAEGVFYGSGQYGTQIPILLVLGRWDGVNYLQQQQFSSRYTKAGQYFCYEVLPAPRDPLNRQFTAINDAYMGFSNSNGLFAGLHVLSSTHNDGYSKWVFNNTVQDVSNLVTWALWHAPTHNACRGYSFVEALHLNNDTPPTDPSGLLPKSNYFPVRGLVYIRTSDAWADNNDIQFSLTAAPAIDRSLDPPNGVLSVKHNQPDKNSITLSAFGQDFIIDVGYEGQRPEDQNYILIDGRGQSPAAIGGGMNEGRIIRYETSSAYDFVQADARCAFDTVYYHGENGTPVPVADPTNSVLNADRYVLSTRATPSTSHFFVVADDIRRDSEFHQYRWIFNTYASVSLSNPIVIQSGGKYLKIWHTEQGIPQAPESQTKLFRSEGSDSPVVKQQQTEVFQISIPTTAVNPFFHMVMVPQQSDATYPIVTNLNQQVSGGSCLKLQWSTHEDYSILKFGSTVTSSFFSTDAKLSQVRKNISSGLPVAFVASNGSQLTYESRELVNLYGQQGTVMRSGTEVDISGASITYFRIYAPNATIVRLNGVSVPLVQVNDYVEPPNVTVNRTWTGEVSTSFTITVSSGVSLTLQPGTHLHFNNGTQLIAYGALTAVGTEQEPIRFLKSSTASNWLGIHVESGLSPSELRHCVITDAITGVSVSSSRFKLKESMISNCSIGIDISGYHPKLYYQVDTNTVQNCWTSGIVINNADNVTIRDNTISGCTAGLVTTQSTARLYRNVIESSSEEGVFAGEYSNPRFGDVLLSDPGNNVIRSSRIAALHAVNSTPFLGMGCERVYGGWNSVYGDALLVHAEKGAYVTANWNWWGFDPPNEEQFLAQDVTIDYDCWMPYDPNEGMRPSASPTLISGNKGGDDPPPILSITPEGIKLRQALALRAQGEYRRALVVYANLIRTSPNAPEARIALSEARNTFYDFIHASNDTTLQSVLEDSLRVYRNVHPNAFVRRLAKALLATEIVNRRDFASAIAEYEQLLQSATTDLERTICLFALFNINAQGTRDRRDAERYLAQLQTLSPGDIRTRIASARLASMIEAEGGNGMQRPSVSGALESITSLPNEFALLQNYPNPFNPLTTIKYNLPTDSRVTLKLYDVLGREVLTIVDQQEQAGYHSTTLDASRLSSGVYFYRLQAGVFTQTKKLVLLR